MEMSMSDLRKAAQAALSYWDSESWGDSIMADKMNALRAALAQPEADCAEAADEIERQTNNADNLRQRVEDLTKECDALKTVMVAAAEEIQAHWSAHCDAEGYGPANLIRRLEEGIPSEYGYTAGAFERLTEQGRTLRHPPRHRPRSR